MIITLGEDIFLKDVVQFERTKQKIRFATPYQMNLKRAPKNSESRLVMISKVLAVPGSITGGPTAYFEIDTGDANDCALYRNNAQVKNWLNANPSIMQHLFQKVTGIGAAGAEHEELIRVHQIKIFGAIFKKLPCAIVDAPVNNPRIIGSIGLALMRFFNVTFDYPAQKVYLKAELK